MKYTASRLSDGNKVFPDEINIDDYSVTIKSPKLFGGASKSFPLGQISVSVSSPMIGYSDITLFSHGTKMSIHGFTSSDAKSIKISIEKGTTILKEEASRQEDNRRKEEDKAWLADLNRKNQRNFRETEKYIAGDEVDRNRSNHYHEEKELDDFALNMQTFQELFVRMKRQAEIEKRELMELEKISLEIIERSLKGNCGYKGEEYFSSSNAHLRADNTELISEIKNNHLSESDHYSAYHAIREVEEYWNLSRSERIQLELKKHNDEQIINKKSEEGPSIQYLDTVKQLKDINKMSEEIQSRLEAETGEKFILIPGFEKFTLRDEPLQIGYLLTNTNRRSIRLNYTVTGELYSSSFWNYTENEAQFTNYLGHYTFEKAINSIIKYYKRPFTKHLVEYAVTDNDNADFREIPRNLRDLLEIIESKNLTSLFVTGQPDEFKTYEVESSMRDDYFAIDGELSGIDLFINLLNNNGKIFIINNSDTSFRDVSFIQVVQQAIATRKIRLIERPTIDSLLSDEIDLPESFKFTGNIIFISCLLKKKIVDLVGQQTNVIEVFLNKEDMIYWLWQRLSNFDIPSVNITEYIKDKAMEYLQKASEETDNIELSLRSLQKAILIANKFEMVNSEICYDLIKQQCSFVSN